MRMLVRDQEVFERQHVAAAAFVRAAALRQECYGLAANEHAHNGFPQPPTRTRFRELLHAPACREPWFVVMLRGDFPGVEFLLVEAGL